MTDPPAASVTPHTAEPRPCARYFGSDGTLCSTHNGRFLAPSETRCDRAAAPHPEPSPSADATLLDAEREAADQTLTYVRGEHDGWPVPVLVSKTVDDTDPLRAIRERYARLDYESTRRPLDTASPEDRALWGARQDVLMLLAALQARPEPSPSADAAWSASDVAYIANCIPWEREDLRVRVRAALQARPAADTKRGPCAHGNPCRESLCVEYGRSDAPARPAADDLGAALDVERVKQAVTNIAVRHGVTKDPPPPNWSLMHFYGYSTTPEKMDAEIAAEYARLSKPVAPEPRGSGS